MAAENFNQIPGFVQEFHPTFRPLRNPSESGKPGIRIRQFESLQHQLLTDNLDPQIIKRIPVGEDGSEVAVVNVLSPYTEKFMHIMLLDDSKMYKPSPAEIGQEEGRIMMEIAARANKHLLEQEGIGATIFGFNCSDKNLGRAETKDGALQTMISKFHPHLCGIPDSGYMKKLSEIPEYKRQFISGDVLSWLQANVLKKYLRKLPLINPESITTSNRGLRAELTCDLTTALRDPDFYPGVIQPVHGFMERMTEDVAGALTDTDYRSVKHLIKDTFEGRHDPHVVYAALQHPPRLLPTDIRERNIKALPGNYPDYLIQKLLFLNPFLRDRESSNETDWIRNGLGYAFGLKQRAGSDIAELRIRPAGRINKSIGGVAEMFDIVTVRQECVSKEAEKEIERNRKELEEFSGKLDDLLPQPIEVFNLHQQSIMA